MTKKIIVLFFATCIGFQFIHANSITKFYTFVEEQCGIINADFSTEIFSGGKGKAGKAIAVNNSRNYTEVSSDIVYQVDGIEESLFYKGEPLFEIEVSNEESGGLIFLERQDIKDNSIFFNVKKMDKETPFYVKVFAKNKDDLILGEHVVTLNYKSKCK